MKTSFPALPPIFQVHGSKIFEVTEVPKEIAPFAEAHVVISACANDVDCEFHGQIEFHVTDSAGSPYSVALKARGQGSTIVFDPDLPERVSLGQQFKSHAHQKRFNVTNYGKRQQRLVWKVENAHFKSGEYFSSVVSWSLFVLIKGECQ